MKNANNIASHVETAIANYINRYHPESEMFRFSPSIVDGRRYCGLTTKDGKQYAIEINVKEV